ncbi:zinc finger and BTB domain-containing protein 11 [Rhinoderma darwinii]|uniref:zinc finger and BTB domain-containing protein 11 n=1 Tax=Rhinoderma darwinii TaxID=43563 RepID=UPI003F67333D
MSSEESYLAILRYLTNEREPYAPGTEGNVKRKIRKAAACYVVRSGTLYYQRRHRDKERFTELEVVLQQERRKGLLEMAHVGAGGEHLTRHQTWHILSQRYWWRGILKQMKDYIKQCGKCQEKVDRSRSSNDPSEMLEELGLEVRSDSNETDDELGNSASGADPKPSRKKPVAKHELVFVDSKGTVKQSSLKHGQAVLSQLNQQRLANQFCDVTLLIEGEEYKAHKSVLAANSEYFRELFIEKGAVSSHEAFVDLSGFCKASFLPLLEFAYTSELCFDFCSMAELVMLARHLYMQEVLEICESVHKQMEEKQLTLYQKGDIQTVASEANVHVAPMEETGDVGTPKLSVVKEVASGQQIVTLENAKCQATEEIIESADSQPNTIATPLTVEATIQLTSDSDIPVGAAIEGTAAIYISNSASDLQPTVLIPTVIEVSSVEQEPPQTVEIIQEVITSEVQLRSESPDTPSSFINIRASESQEMPNQESVAEEQTDVSRNNSPTEVTHPVDAQGSPCVDMDADVDIKEENELQSKPKETLKRKRGKSPKSPKSPGVEESASVPAIPDVVDHVSSEGTAVDGASSTKVDSPSSGTDTATLESPGSSEMDPYKSKLRERSVGEGGYIQMHRGKEKSFNRKTIPKSAVQQAARKLVQIGKKRMLPSKKEAPKVEEEHKCKECGMVFERKYALILHSVKHDRVIEFKCPLCKKEFQYRASLRAHLIRHSRKTEPAAAETEATKGRTKRQYICDICGRTLPKMCSLRLHMLKHTGVKPHACHICQKTFTHKHGLKMHQALHETHKPFKCDMCDKSFVTNRSLQEHVSTHTGETKYLCTMCGKTFHRASGLSKHLKKHRPKPDVRQYHCTQCERSFSEARDLQQHMNKHLGVKPFECEVCGKCYSWKKDWYSHVKSHSVTEPYRCNICGKEFFEKSLFRRHVNKATHGKKGRIKRNVERVCNHCGKTFTQLREFRRHVNNHEGVKPFECLTCGVAWADARSLKRHVRTHTGERPYVCPVCNEAYIDARNLRKHMTKYHNNYIPCKIMLEKDSLQFHHQGTQVEHAVSFLPNDIVESQSEIVSEEIETVIVAGDVVESVEDVSSTQDCSAVSSLSDQSIMQVVNYVLSQQGGKLPDVTDNMETVEVEVDQAPEVL